VFAADGENMSDTISTKPGNVTTLRHESRAALRSVEAGNYVDCAACGERVKFQAKIRRQQVICNVYVDGRWDRVEHYHAECYAEAGEPYGTAA
jgi:hypothetical protein